jgi:cold shock CspA family protein
MSFTDKHLGCRDCGGQFIFTAGEQEFYAQKGFANSPVRCALRRRMIKGLATDAAYLGEVCPQDVTQSGSVVDTVPINNNRRTDTSWTNRSQPSRERKSTDIGDLPVGTVEASVVRIDASRRYLFVRVAGTTIDAYVHSSMFRQYDANLRESDVVYVDLESTARGPRVTSFRK